MEDKAVTSGIRSSKYLQIGAVFLGFGLSVLLDRSQTTGTERDGSTRSRDQLQSSLVPSRVMLNVEPDPPDGEETHAYMIPPIKTRDIHGDSLNSRNLISPSPSLAQNDFDTSVWCEGDRLQNRRCTFKNLCFQPRWENHGVLRYVFFIGANSTLSNVPVNHPEDTQKLLDLSSTPGHLRFTFRYVMMPSSPDALSSFGSVQFIDSKVLMVHRLVPDNLFHAFHDNLLPTFFTLFAMCAGRMDRCLEEVGIFYVDVGGPGPLFPLYQTMSNRAHVFRSDLLEAELTEGSKLYCMKEAYAGLEKHSLWYDIGVNKEFEGPVENTEVAGRDFEVFGQFFIKRLCEKFDPKGVSWCTVDHSCKPHLGPYAVILSRKSNRRILNEHEVIQTTKRVLEEQSGLRLGDGAVKTMSMEETSFLEQVCSIRYAGLIIGMHGAMLALTIFARPGALVIELFPYAVVPEHLATFKSLSDLPGRNIVHISWANDNEVNSVAHPEYPGNQGGLTGLSEKEAEVVANTMPVPRVQCCDNPLLLHRLYQDTIVDLKALKRLLLSGISQQKSYFSNPLNT